MNLRNLRRIETPEGPAMAADFTAADGRPGSVSVLMAEYQAHGEAALELEARFVVRDLRRRDVYMQPEADRFSELG